MRTPQLMLSSEGGNEPRQRTWRWQRGAERGSVCPSWDQPPGGRCCVGSWLHVARLPQHMEGLLVGSYSALVPWKGNCFTPISVTVWSHESMSLFALAAQLSKWAGSHVAGTFGKNK